MTVTLTNRLTHIFAFRQREAETDPHSMEITFQSHIESCHFEIFNQVGGQIAVFRSILAEGRSKSLHYRSAHCMVLSSFGCNPYISVLSMEINIILRLVNSLKEFP